MKRICLYLLFSQILCNAVLGQDPYFFKGGGSFNAAIPEPQAFLGYPIGSAHTRHDRIVAYFKHLDQLSDRMKVITIGETFEHREQIIAIFTSPGHHQNLEEIRKQHLASRGGAEAQKIPLVIHLGYNVHGNEPSSSEAAMLTAWYLVASDAPETRKWLDEMVILMDPVINPDGRDRHSHWANMHKAEPPVADPLDREHTEVWPGGRFNHYWFDLNRDWFLGTFPETRNRIRTFHQWRPYVQTDHHEMGTNSTFYFDPGKDGSNNPVVPDLLYKEVYPRFGTYFARAADSIGSLYFTKEAFDKLYPGYGSSYINFYGGAGFLFEQGSSRGHVQETSTIPIKFAFTIRNQYTASLATIRASLAEKGMLLKLRQEFYRVAAEQARKSAVKAYMIGCPEDPTRMRAFLQMLKMHEIDVYENPTALTIAGNRFLPGQSWVVPVDQPNYIMVRSVFENQISYLDSTFYDASTWSLVHAYGIPFREISGQVNRGVRVDSVRLPLIALPTRSEYAYLIDASDYAVHAALYGLQERGVITQVATRSFTAVTAEGPRSFGYGTVVIPVGLQKIHSDSLFRALTGIARKTPIPIWPVATGFNQGGVDLGSNYVRTVTQPRVAMLVGQGLAATEAGEVWHLLDQRLGMPISKIDWIHFGRTDLNRYNTLVMVSGDYGQLDTKQVDRIKTWIQQGGTLITLKTASEWAINKGLATEKIQVDTVKKPMRRFNYDEAQGREGSRAMGGAIFSVDLDTTHPIGFGYARRKLSVYRNGNTYLSPSINPYSTVAQYAPNPLVGGYVHPETLAKIKQSAAILVSGSGRGRVILFADNPNFRGTWYGTNKLFLNALFFGQLAGVPDLDDQSD